VLSFSSVAKFKFKKNVFAPEASHNSYLKIFTIQKGRRIGKKVYYVSQNK